MSHLVLMRPSEAGLPARSRPRFSGGSPLDLFGFILPFFSLHIPPCLSWKRDPTLPRHHLSKGLTCSLSEISSLCFILTAPSATNHVSSRLTPEAMMNSLSLGTSLCVWGPRGLLVHEVSFVCFSSGTINSSPLLGFSFLFWKKKN